MNILITGNYNNLKKIVVMLYSLFVQETGEVNVYIPVVKTDDENLRCLSMYVESWQEKRLIPLYNLEEFQRRYIDITKQLAKEAAVIHFTEESSPCNPEREEDEMYDSFDMYYEDMEGDAMYQYRCVTGQVAGESSLPVLIYYGVTYCYNILNDILAQFGAAFRRKGMRVIYYDEQKGDVAGLSRYFGRRFKAVIGVQSYLFSVRLQSGEYIHDNILGPKFNIVLDHPVWLHSQLMNVPEDYYVLWI